MAYSTNPYLPRARATALKLLLVEGLPLSVVADRSGVHRTTLWRWLGKWRRLNVHRQLANANRPSRSVGKEHLRLCRWLIPTDSARPHSHPKAIPEVVVRQVLAVRQELGRCAEVVWYHLKTVVGVKISLSSVKRIFRRNHVYDRPPKTRRRVWHPPLARPQATCPGALVQTDTVHLYHPVTGQKYYLYTVIDLYSRMAHASLHTVLRPGIAARTLLEAQTRFGFSFTTVQTDHGPEFSTAFKHRVSVAGVRHRHSRLQRPNDNAHIERFNRTIQEECTGSYLKTTEPLTGVQARLAAYLDYYNTKRVHLGIQLRTPAAMLQR